MRLRKAFLSLFFLLSLFAVAGRSEVFAKEVLSPQCMDPGTGTVDLFKCYRLNPSQAVSDVYTNPSVLVNLLVKVAFIGAGIIIFFLIIYSGFSFITGGTKGQEKAKNTMTTAIVGLLIMFAAFWALQIIKILTGTTSALGPLGF